MQSEVIGFFEITMDKRVCQEESLAKRRAAGTCQDFWLGKRHRMVVSLACRRSMFTPYSTNLIVLLPKKRFYASIIRFE